MGIAIINLPFWDGLHHLFMMVFGGGLLLPSFSRNKFCLVFKDSVRLVHQDQKKSANWEVKVTSCPKEVIYF